jgi:hypothetical protein
MRMITRRLNDLVSTDDKAERTEIAKETQKLVRALYNNHKSSHDKLATIRDALDA